MLSPLFSDEEVNLLYSLRSRALECKMNFQNKYPNGDLSCSICTEENDDQQHILRCKILQSKLESEDITNGQVEYEDIFRDHHKQKVIVTMYKKLLQIRKKLLENMM